MCRTQNSTFSGHEDDLLYRASGKLLETFQLSQVIVRDYGRAILKRGNWSAGSRFVGGSRLVGHLNRVHMQWNTVYKPNSASS